MTGRTDQKRQGRGLSKRALVLSLAVYIFGLALTTFGAKNEMLRYAGFALIGAGSIAFATALVDAVISISTGLKTALILALIGVAAFAVWTDLQI